MTIIGERLLPSLVAYLINLAAGERSAAIAATRANRLKEALEKDEALQRALSSAHSIRDEFRGACAELGRNRAHLGIPAHEEPLWQLLSDEIFQANLTEWLMAGAITEGDAAKSRLLETMEAVLTNSGASPEAIAFLKTGYFEAVDKAVFAHPILAHWRHQLSLDYLREQVAVLRQRADEAVGRYSPEKQAAALERYCEKALAAWDIIDLSNLPEGDVQITTQQLLLRQLYMPLRIQVEPTKRGEADDAALARLEDLREVRRHREAGHFFADENDKPARTESRSPVGKRLDVSRRLVVLGDPGGGKTTMLRWMATAYLLRHKDDVAFNKVPDTETLPKKSWIPVLIRCRDLGEEDLCRCFTDFLTQNLNKTELLPDEANVMCAVILDRIANGKALVLVDGLDEITNPQVRMMFCQELERTAARYPGAPIVVTSRVVGYRDMPYRMGTGFEHGVIAELGINDKDLFARRWVEVTEQHQSFAEKAKRVKELLDALHSSDRIERLTGNPMLLTTLALVKRKVGKLPNRRTKLYAEAVSVLLNWNPRLYQTIDDDEAIPQLEYLAYEMCRRGVQRLTDDEVLNLLEKLRVEYPNIRSIRHRKPEEFLALLEARSSILIKSGGIWQQDKKLEEPVWEFRHLTFQEYLAAHALLDGRYPGRDKSKSLAEQVAPLAAAVKKAAPVGGPTNDEAEAEIPESWREALRLLVADCKDDDVDDVILGILNPVSDEDPAMTVRPRVALAALCLADEPNVSESTARQVLRSFSARVAKNKEQDEEKTSIGQAANEVASSVWSPLLKQSMFHDYCQRTPSTRPGVGSVWGFAEVNSWKKSGVSLEIFVADLVKRLQSGERFEVLSATFTVGVLALEGNLEGTEHLPPILLNLLRRPDLQVNYAAAIALGWLSKGPLLSSKRKWIWVPKGDEVNCVNKALDATPEGEINPRSWLAYALGVSKDCRAFPALMRKLDDADATVRRTVVQALGQLGDKQALPPLLSKLDDSDATVRRTVIEVLVTLGDRQSVAPLLVKLDDAEATVRVAVIKALGQLGDKQSVAPLIARLDDSNTAIRRAVIRALGQLGDKQSVAPLLAKLDDTDTTVREVVIQSLGQLGDKQSVAPLVARLDDKNTAIRRAVIRALGQLGDNQSVAPLIARLDDTDTAVREVVIQALGQLCDKQSIAALRARLDDTDTTIRRAVIRALGQLGDKQSVAPLIARLDDTDTAVRESVIQALGQLGDKQSIAPLIARLDDTDTTIRRAVIRALGQLGDKQSVAPLMSKFDVEDVNIGTAIAAALHALRQPEGIVFLTRFLASEKIEVRRAAVRSYAQHKDILDQRLLSQDLDAFGPWLDSGEPITEARVIKASAVLNTTLEQVRSRYESIAADLSLKLNWKV
jgi:HEAT repeat protein